ncbi:ubiquitin-conjugating enzyme/RWD-like protein, partial [Cladochytrium replicatum]
VEREIRQCLADKDFKVEIVRVNDSLNHLKGIFAGPTGTPYEGGKLGRIHKDIRIPDNYPFTPPKVKFETMIYHPNVSSQTGAICLDILKDNWTPVFTLKSMLLSLSSLMSDPNPSDPQDAEVAGVFIRNRDEFNRTAKKWAEIYGGAPTTGEDPVDEIKLKKLLEMGFDRAQIRQALIQHNNDEDRALDALLSG